MMNAHGHTYSGAVSILHRLFLHRFLLFTLAVIMLSIAYDLIGRETFLANRTYVALAQVMSIPRAWGASAGVIGLCGLFAVISHRWLLRALAAGFLGAGYFVLAFVLVRGNPYGLTWRLCAGFAALGAALAYSTAHIGIRVSKDLAAADLSRPLAR